MKQYQSTLFQLFVCTILATTLGGCANLGNTRINTDPAQQADVLSILESANQAYSDQNWSEAERAYRKIIIIMERDEFSHFRLGNTILRQGRFEEATGHFKKSIALNPEFIEARHNLSTCYLLMAEAQLDMIEKIGNETQKAAAISKRTKIKEAASVTL